MLCLDQWIISIANFDKSARHILTQDALQIQTGVCGCLRRDNIFYALRGVASKHTTAEVLLAFHISLHLEANKCFVGFS